MSEHVEMAMAHVKYFWDDIEDNVIEEYEEIGAPITAYTTEPTHFGAVLTQNWVGDIRHYHYDGQGNTVSLTDGACNITDTRSYSAFGDVSRTAGASVFSYEYGGEAGYMLQSLQSDTYIRHRTYSAITARWKSSDPYSSTLKLSFEYVANSPTNYVDPSGLQPRRYPPVSTHPSKPDPNKTRCIFCMDAKPEEVTFCLAQAKALANQVDYGFAFPGVITDYHQILDFIRTNKCCDIWLFGHQGGQRTNGGVVTFPANRREPTTVLPNSDFHLALRDLLGDLDCRNCSISIVSCTSEYLRRVFKTRQRIGIETGCSVFAPNLQVIWGILGDIGTYQTPDPGLINSNWWKDNEYYSFCPKDRIPGKGAILTNCRGAYPMQQWWPPVAGVDPTRGGFIDSRAKYNE